MAVAYASGWRTRFWSAGLEHRAGEWTFLGQLMTGTTRIAPHGEVYDTDFDAGYALATRTFGDWQPVVRFDMFQIQQGEHGNGLTAALNWRPHERVRVIGEWLRIDSKHFMRPWTGLAERHSTCRPSSRCASTSEAAGGCPRGANASRRAAGRTRRACRVRRGWWR